MSTGTEVNLKEQLDLIDPEVHITGDVCRVASTGLAIDRDDIHRLRN